MATPFDDVLNDVVQIEPAIAADDYGGSSYGPAVSYFCRVSGKEVQTTNMNGSLIATKAVVYIMGNPAINPDDRITMPAGFAPQNPVILGVNTVKDEQGPHHVEILV